ncbi:Heat shock factor binding [Fagus crenata]
MDVGGGRIHDAVLLGTNDGHDSDDPKQSTADMTVFVQNLLQQMQTRFQTMSESIITKNILFLFYMGSRIDELEQSINELRTEMGVEGSPSPSAPSQPKLEPKSTEDST